MTTITTRSGKGSPLTNNEVDANFTNLNDDKVEASGDSMTGNLSFGDNNKAIFGAGSDLQIYHDGSASYVQDTGTGALYLQGDGGVNIRNAAGTENKAVFASDGAVTLYHNNAVKFETTSTGIDVTGTVVSNGFTLENNAEYLNVKNSSGSSTRAFGVNGANNLYIGGIDADIGPILFVDNGATLATLGPTGLDVTGSVTADGLTVDAGSTSLIGTLQTTANNSSLVYADSSQTLILKNDDASGTARLKFLGTASESGAITFGGGVGATSDTFAVYPRVMAGGKAFNITGGGDITFYDTDGTTASFVYDASAGLTINEAGADRDFRVESDDNTHMLFLDAGQNAIGINNSGPSGVKLSVLGASTAAVGWGDVSDRGFLSFDGSGNPIVRAGTGLSLKIQANSSRDVATFGTSETVFNEPGNNQDFRVESDNNSNILFIDASADTVNIGNTTDFGGILNVNGGLNSKQAVFTSTNNRGLALSTASRGGQNDGVAIIDAQDTESTGGRFEIHTMGAERARFERDQIVFNEGSNDQDFRVESDDNTHALYMDANTSTVGINSQSTSDTLTVFSSASDKGITIHNGSTSGFENPTLTFIDQGNSTSKLAVRGDAFCFDTYGAANTVQIVGSSGLFKANNASQLEGGVVINDNSTDVDFRVESDTNSTALFMDASLSYVGINRSPAVELDIKRVTNATPVRIGSEGGEGRGIVFADVASSTTKYNFFVGAQQNHNNTFEITPSTVIGGYTFTNVALAIDELSSVVVNQTGVSSADFRVESDGNANMLFVDAGNNNVIIGSSGASNNAQHLAVHGNTGLGNRLTSSPGGGYVTEISGTSLTTDGSNWYGSYGVLNFYATASYTGSARRWTLTNGWKTNRFAFLVGDTDTSSQPELNGNGGSESNAFVPLWFDSLTGGAVFNDYSKDADFRVESDGNANAFVVDAGSDYVSVGQNSVTNPGNGNNNSGWSATTAGRMWASTGADHGFNRTSDGVVLSLRSGGVERGKISISGSTTTYATTSDARAKENIVDAPSASDDIDAIQVRSFDWKADGSHQKYGMVAQELLSIAPDAVAQGDSEEDMMGVDYSRLVPMLIKEIQSLRARVAQLESN